MPKIFKDPSRHFKSSDHHNKPHITLVNGMHIKNLANYIYNGMKDISDENILRSANQRGYSIIYFTDPKKTFESSIFKNKDVIKEGRAKLKFFIAGLAYNLEKNSGSKINEKIQTALNNLRELAHDFSRDIKAGELKKPLEIILNEITTPKELRRKKITSPHKATPFRFRGVDRQALSRFNKMDELEIKNLINLIFHNDNINPLNTKELLDHIASKTNTIQEMQKFIRAYIMLRTTTTSMIVRLAKSQDNLNDIEIFCEAWAKTREDLINKPYVRAQCSSHNWSSEMDRIVATLNKLLFQAQSENSPISNVFSDKINDDEKKIHSSPILPTGSVTYYSVQSPTDNLSPGYFIEDSAEKKLLELINKGSPQIVRKIKKTIKFNESPSHPIDGDMQGQNSTKVTPSQAKDIKSNAFLSSSLEKKLEHDVMSSSGEFYSFLSPIKSPTTFPQRRSSSTIANQQAIGDEELNQLIADLSIEPKSSTRFNNFHNENIEDNLNSEETNFLANADYGNPEHTPEKPDPDAPKSLQNKIQSAVRKASSNLTYQPMPTQQVSNTNPNPSTTNAINNSINNRN